MIYRKNRILMRSPDAPSWHAAMDCEKESLAQMGTFEEVELSPGERVVGLKWVYAYKMNADDTTTLG
jgi:hypothetical protein